MEFNLCGISIHDVKNIEFKDNEDDTFQLWFSAIATNYDNKKQLRFHIPRMKLNPSILSIEEHDGILFEIIDNE